MTVVGRSLTVLIRNTADTLMPRFRQSGEPEALLQRAHAIARHRELHARLPLEPYDEMAVLVRPQLARPSDVHEHGAMDAKKPRRVELALEVRQRRIEHVFRG